MVEYLKKGTCYKIINKKYEYFDKNGNQLSEEEIENNKNNKYWIGTVEKREITTNTFPFIINEINIKLKGNETFINDLDSDEEYRKDGNLIDIVKDTEYYISTQKIYKYNNINIINSLNNIEEFKHDEDKSFLEEYIDAEYYSSCYTPEYEEDEEEGIFLRFAKQY
jgi:hypothetical protein